MNDCLKKEESREKLMKKTLLLLICISAQGLSQHFIPFASADNRIELSVGNESIVAAKDVTIEVSSAPQWVKFTNPKTQIPYLEPNSAQTASFTFSVDKTSPVSKPEQVTFTIANSHGERWTKTILLQVSPRNILSYFRTIPIRSILLRQ